MGEGYHARFSGEETEASRALNHLLKVMREHTAPEYQVRLVQCHNPALLLGLYVQSFLFLLMTDLNSYSTLCCPFLNEANKAVPWSGHCRVWG